jgi:hypothetical protein
MKMKRIIMAIIFLGAINHFVSAAGFFMEGGLGYNTDQNVGLGFVNTSKGFYSGVGVGIVFDGVKFKVTFGCNIDFLIHPEISFVRGEEHYQVENMADQASLRVMPYVEISRMIKNWLYAGFGMGYGYNNIYFSMRPLLYDADYTSYQLSTNSFTPSFFLRAYIVASLYISLNYEVDIITSGEIKRVAGDPMADFADILAATDIKGVHHRVRLVFGYVLGFE